MSSNRLFNSQRFNRLVTAVLLVWIASAAFGIYLLTRFDTLITASFTISAYSSTTLGQTHTISTRR